MIEISRKVLTAEQRKRLLATPAGWLACGFGSGLTPKAQGTAGSLAALLPWWWLRDMPPWAWLLLLVVGFVVGVWACDVSSRTLGVDDHRSLVWDEFIGQWLALFPLLLMPAPWWMILVGFGLFRLFDVWKPWPIGWIDRRVKGGFGVMVDDVVAGVMAALVLSLLLVFWRV